MLFIIAQAVIGFGMAIIFMWITGIIIGIPMVSLISYNILKKRRFNNWKKSKKILVLQSIGISIMIVNTLLTLLTILFLLFFHCEVC